MLNTDLGKPVKRKEKNKWVKELIGKMEIRKLKYI